MDRDRDAQNTSEQDSRSEYDRLLLRIKEGDWNALRELYEETARIVYSYSLSICRNPQDAEEIMQDTFLRVWQQAGRYEAGGRPLAWIFTIARNLCYMRLRRQNLRPVDSLEELQVQEGFWEPGETCAEVELAAERQALLEAMTFLTQGERQAIFLHILGGMKHREIAEQMKIPLSTVLSRYRRGMEKLRQNLDG